MAVQDYFVWGAGGQKLTPGELARRREVEDAILARGVDTSPVGHWTQGAARVADAIAGAFRRGQVAKGEKEIANVNKGLISSLLAGGGASAPSSGANVPMPGAAAEISATSPGTIGNVDPSIRDGIVQTASALGIDPVDLATAISYETAGTFDPTKSGPTTQWGQHRGLIQFGEPQAKEYGVNWEDPIGSQLGENGAVANYLRATGVQPGMGLMDIYSAINAGGVGRYGASDANNGGAPGTVADKVNNQMAGHRAKALALLGTGQPADAAQAIEAVAPEAAGEIAMQPASSSQPMQVAGGGDRVPMASASTGINPAIIEALTNPQASEQTQRIAGILLEQEQARQKAAFDRSKPIEVNGRIINPMTGQVIADYSDPKTATVGNSVIDLRTGKPIYEGPQEPKTATVGNTVVDVRTGQPVYQGQPEATTGMREYDAYAADEKAAGRTPIGRLEYEQAIKKAGANSTTNIVGGEGDKFYENLDKKNAETFATLSDSGMQARSKMVQIDRLEALLSQSPQGYEAGIKQWLGDLGVQTEGLDALQSTRALLEKMVPAQRPPGSGPMSDADIVMFRNSLPRLINQPGGNELILQTMRGIAQYEMQMGEIADLVADRAQLADGTKVTPSVGRQMIRDLKNPLDGLNKIIKQSGTAAATSGPDIVPTDIPGVTIRRKN